MKLHLKGEDLELYSPRIMGSLVVHPKDIGSVDDFVRKAKEMQEDGADLIEIGLQVEEGFPEENDELAKLIPIVKAVAQNTSLYVAITTKYPSVMKSAVGAGASLIIDPDALKAEGALDTVAMLKVPVCLVFDHNIDFDKEGSLDPMGDISAYLYERIDACLNAGIDRRNLLIDPSLSQSAPIESKLKLIGRLETLKSFALPMTMAMPRSIPHADNYLNEHFSAAVAACLFCVNSGVKIIRTERVEELALALDTWQAVNKSARPFKLTRAIASRFKRKHAN